MAIWPFGRRRSADEPDPEPVAGASASPSEGEADVARPERVPSGDWMTVPPVRTSMAPAMPTTFRVQTLPEILTSHQDSRLSSSLGHAVSSEAPSGVIGGLASATSSLGAVSHESAGGAPSELHEPAHPAKPDPEPVVPTQRRLAAASDAPLAVSAPGALGSVAPPAPALPEPAVSRVLASPGPMPSPASLGANPLPVARVVDTSPAGGRTPSPAPSPEAPAATAPPAPSGPTAPVDDRVGGFEVDLATLLGPSRSDDDLPIITPPADLAPPIQRSVRQDATPPILRAPVQRSAEPAAPAPGPTLPAITPAPAPGASGDPAAAGQAGAPAAASTAGEMAPIQRQAATGATPPAASADGPSTPSSREAAPASGPIERAGTGEAAPSAPATARPTVGTEPVVGTAEGPSLATTGAGAQSAAGAGPVDLPLVAPAVQRSPETEAATGSHFAGDGHDHGDEDGAVQRSAAPGGSAGAGTSPPAADASSAEAAVEPAAASSAGDAPPAAVAPVAGDDPLAPVSAGGALDDGDTGTVLLRPTGEELPLVARLAEPSAPTLGTDGGGGSGIVPLQTLSDPVPTRTDSTAALPLAPPEQPGTITPPAPRASASTGLVGDGPAPLVTGSSSGPGPAGAARPLAAQRQAEPGAATSSASGGPTAGGTGPLPFVAQRLASTTASASPTSGPMAAPAVRPLSSSAGHLLLAAPAGSAGAGATAAPAMTVLGAPPADAPAVPLQRDFDADAVGAGDAPASPPPNASTSSHAGGSTGPATSTGALPLARSAGAGPSGPATPVTPLVAQRALDDGGGPSASGRSPMPLHTAASAVPTTTDLLVKAGLGEKAPDGSFLRSTPPPGVESSFTVQTMPDAATPASSPQAAAVQRALAVDEVSTEATGGTSGSGSGAESAEDVRKLYLKVRAELEADLRRQLEAKSRYNRYRP